MLLMLPVFLPVHLSAQTFEYGGLKYTVLDAMAKTVQTAQGSNNVAGNEVSGAIVIPEKVNDGTNEYTVTAIGNLSFYNCSELSSITIPGTVTSIGVSAFYHCYKMTDITIPESVTAVSERAFESCAGLTNIVIPNSVKSIGAYAFYMCGKLQSIILSESLTTIGSHTFRGCEALTGITIPKSVTSIGDEAFESCYKLEEITIPAAVTSIGDNTFQNCLALKTVNCEGAVPAKIVATSFSGRYEQAVLIVPDNGVGNYLASAWSAFTNLKGETSGTPETRTIGSFTYRRLPDGDLCLVKGNYSSLTSVDIPTQESWNVGETQNTPNVTVIGYGAFQNCTKLTEVDLPGYIKEIGESAFEGCTALEKVTVQGGINPTGKVCDNAFKNCAALMSMTFSFSEFGDYAFYGCKGLTGAVEPYNATSIGDYAFAECNSIPTLKLDGKLTHLGAHAFQDCHMLNKLELNCSGLTELNASAFRGCFTLKKIELSAGIQTIGTSAFEGCTALESVVFNDALTEIGDNAFKNCDKLAALTIPVTIQSIGAGAFSECDVLTDVKVADSGAPITFGSGVFPTALKTLYLGRNWSCAGTGSLAPGLSSLTIGNVVTGIPAGAFAQATELKTLILGSSVRTIGDNAFKGAPLTDSIILSPATESVGAGAFDGNGVSEIAIGSKVAEIGARAFYGTDTEACVLVGAKEPPVATDGETFNSYAGVLKVPFGSKDDYVKSEYCWKNWQKVEVMIAAESLKIEGGDVLPNLKTGETAQLTATLLPATAEMKYIFWRSTNPDYAIVDNEGLVTVVGTVPEPQGAAKAAPAVDCKIIAETLYADGPVAVASFGENPTGIDGVEMDDTVSDDGRVCPNDIYNMQGICLKRNATSADIRALRPGLYIIAGKKVLVP